MQRNSEWRKYARSYAANNNTFWFHPSSPAQAVYVGDFLRDQDNVDVDAMGWRVYLFYIIQGFLIDFESKEDTLLSAYIESIEGLALTEAFEAHMSHPLLSESEYDVIVGAYNETRDSSLQETKKTLDVDSDTDTEAIEKKEVG